MKIKQLGRKRRPSAMLVFSMTFCFMLHQLLNVTNAGFGDKVREEMPAGWAGDGGLSLAVPSDALTWG